MVDSFVPSLEPAHRDGALETFVKLFPTPASAVPVNNSLVAVYVFLCHGDLNQGRTELSDNGVLQIGMSAAQHLGNEAHPPIRFVASHTSEDPVTRQTVLIALEKMGHTRIPTTVMGGFQIGPLINNRESFRAVDQAVGPDTTAKGWMAQWSGAAHARGTIRLTMNTLVASLTALAEGSIPVVLVGHHPRFAALAADNINDLGVVRNGDFVVYYVSRNQNGDPYFHAVTYACPLNE